MAERIEVWVMGVLYEGDEEQECHYCGQLAGLEVSEMGSMARLPACCDCVGPGPVGTKARLQPYARQRKTELDKLQIQSFITCETSCRYCGERAQYMVSHEDYPEPFPVCMFCAGKAQDGSGFFKNREIFQEAGRRAMASLAAV